MNDPNLVFRSMVADALVTLVDDRIWCPRLEANYDPKSMGEALSYHTRGGSGGDELPFSSPSLQVNCWAPDPVRARALYTALRTIMRDKAKWPPEVMDVMEDTYGQDAVDPETDWNYVLAFFTLQIRD